MRAVVHETDFVVPAYEVANGFVAILGVYDTGGVVDVDQIHQVANFSDEILRIREEKGIKPRRTREEMVAHVICEDAVDNNHKPGKTPNERYFAAINGVNEMIGYAALDRTVALPPHPVRIREFGISDQVNERGRAAYAGVLAAVLAGTLCHAEKQGWLGDEKRKDFEVHREEPSDADIRAMLSLGFAHLPERNVFSAPLLAARREIGEHIIRIAML